ncbi:hypothetical protein MWU49_04170 [Alcanivorax sp. S6407]|uniref:hypothetical protein n=1 Tax=Alcanivorax sp. S6407 TaxID=2926424 RepID=UPI001FF3FA34|nr:hypothetical protein [Alcanivorax sp. S6407]
MSNFKLLFMAISSEMASLMLLLSEDTSAGHFIAYLLAHGLASALMSIVAWRFLPLRFRTPKILSLMLIFGFAFFIPAIGLFTILGGVVVGVWLPAIFRERPFLLVDAPYYTPVQAATGSTFRQIDIQSLLSSDDSPDALRMQGMLVLKDMPARVTSKFLRESLGDRYEDVRLLSYGILDQKEKAITRDIDRLLQLLERAKKSRRYGLARRLAELYWELNYQDLVRGDIRTLTLEKAAYYADMALMESPQDAGLWVLRGRIQLAQGSIGEAQQSLVFSRRLGLSPNQVNPWLAEIAMVRRQFPLVRRLMSEISDNSQFTHLNKSVEYWRGNGLSHR